MKRERRVERERKKEREKEREMERERERERVENYFACFSYQKKLRRKR